jgi:hypothetical protein
MSRRRTRAAVLGGGIQGVSAALALAADGYDVTLVEQDLRLWQRASLRNEGKIHLGFVYAHDEGFRTPALMLRAALAFGPLLDRWLPAPLEWSAVTTRPFTYLVLDESMVSAEAIERAYHRLDAAYRDAMMTRGGSRLHYLGQRPSRLWQPVAADDLEAGIARRRVRWAARTVETAVDLEALGARLCDAVRHRAGIEVACGRRVRDVSRTSYGFRVAGDRADGDSWRVDADLVINCLWSGRLALDAALGIAAPRPWVHRLKYRVLGWLPTPLRALPSITMALGRFGDIVVRDEGRVYLSWYPACLQGWDAALVTPPEWEGPCTGHVSQADASRVARATLEGLDTVLHGITATRVDMVDAGTIFCWGRTDIDDPGSELHERHRIGVAMHDGYVSIDTGKLTCAPLFAGRLVDILQGRSHEPFEAAAVGRGAAV